MFHEYGQHLKGTYFYDSILIRFTSDNEIINEKKKKNTGIIN